MKKNIAMRIAAFLFILTMISTCAFATTFAKYTTKGEATDTARVAKWGVNINVATVDGITYEYDETNQDAHILSNADKKLIAPGSKIKLGSITVSGQPEVAVNVTYTATLTLTGWKIGEKDYCPLVFVVDGQEIKMEGEIDTVAELITAVQNAIASSEDYDVNTDLSKSESKEVNVSCYWDFNETDAPNDYQSDEKDTALGNLTGADVPTISLSITCTVTQID